VQFDAERQEPLRQALKFHKHAHDWSNRLVAGDSLLVMNSLLEKEGMAGKVQMMSPGRAVGDLGRGRPAHRAPGDRSHRPQAGDGDLQRYPCHRIAGLAKGHVNLLAEGKRMTEIGLDRWVEEQEERKATGFAYVDIRCHPYEVPDK